MREIKFRALELDAPNGINWVYGYYVVEKGFWKEDGIDNVDKPVVRYYIIGERGERYDVCKDTVGQFTGLHDKNGVEIYEGDILKNEYYVFACYYETGKARFFLKSLFDYGLNQFVNTLEIIGNIHENPELLEEK